MAGTTRNTVGVRAPVAVKFGATLLYVGDYDARVHAIDADSAGFTAVGRCSRIL